MTIKQCKNCNKDFEARAATTKFCSPRCKSQDKAKQQKAQRRQERIDQMGERHIVIEELIDKHNILWYQAAKMYDNNLDTIPPRYPSK